MPASHQTSGTRPPWLAIFDRELSAQHRDFASLDEAIAFLESMPDGYPVAVYNRNTKDLHLVDPLGKVDIEKLRSVLATLPLAQPDPVFRGDIPEYRAPDRQEWQREHGTQPYQLEDVPEKFLTRAQGALRRDSETIEFDAAIHAQERLDPVHEAVHAHFDLSEDTLVFFDPTTDSFWGYPL